jgi:hypothetical protein
MGLDVVAKRAEPAVGEARYTLHSSDGATYPLFIREAPDGGWVLIWQREGGDRELAVIPKGKWNALLNAVLADVQALDPR